MRIGKRLQYYRIDQTEYRRVGADAEGENEHRCDGKPGRLEQYPERVAKRLDKTVHRFRGLVYLGRYSLRAVIGLIRVARSAGTKQAKHPAKQRTRIAINIEIGSIAVTP